MLKVILPGDSRVQPFFFLLKERCFVDKFWSRDRLMVIIRLAKGSLVEWLGK